MQQPSLAEEIRAFCVKIAEFELFSHMGMRKLTGLAEESGKKLAK